MATNRRDTLTGLHERLTAALDNAEDPRDLTALSKELRAVVAELDVLSVGEEVDTVDDLAARRAARLADAAGQ